MATGHGSAAQQTPQPLHGAPKAGLGGAAAWISMIRLGGVSVTNSIVPALGDQINCRRHPKTSGHAPSH